MLRLLIYDTGLTRKIRFLKNLITIALENYILMTSSITQIVEVGQKLARMGLGISDL